MSTEVPKNTVPVMAQELVSEILSDLESSMQRAAYFFKSGDDAYNYLFLPMALKVINQAGLGDIKTLDSQDVQYTTTYRGERRNLTVYTKTDNWVDAFFKIHHVNHTMGLHIHEIIKVGDYVRIPVKVPACEVNGMEFKALDTEAEAIVVDIINGKIIFQFEEILFFSAINKENGSKAALGFQSSDLSDYLNDPFMTAVFGNIKEYMVSNRYGNLITLPTRYEIYGEEDEEDDEKGNWKGHYQLEYFKKIKNRIRVYENETRWYWTSTPSSAASFALVSSYGGAGHFAASAVGGCAPAFCIY